MPLSPIRIALLATLVVTVGFVWYREGRGRWRRLAADRFVYGIPWGTLVTVAVVVAFYLLAQDGARGGDPIVLPYITWSYFYPLGLFTAGIAHGSLDHLVSNVTATLVLAPIAEYAWGHYPPSRRAGGEPRSDAAPDTEPDVDPDPYASAPGVADRGPRDESAPLARGSTDRGSLADGGTDRTRGPLARPWVRAFVAFPAALLGVALFTAVFSLGPGLGFSGVVYAIAGFAVVTYPVATLVGIVGASALGTLYEAVAEPVVRETVEAGAPGPPAWAGVGFQAHAVGFLLGVLLGIALLRRRRRRPAAERVFFATLLLGMVQALWLVAWPGGDDVYYLYQGVGVVLVLLLATLVTVAVAGSDRPLLPSLPDRLPTSRQVAVGWLFVVALVLVGGLAGVLVAGEPAAAVALALVAVLLALPALPSMASDRRSRLSRRGVAVACLLVALVVVALPSVPFGMFVVGDDAVPGSGEVAAGDYAVTYEENATGGRVPAVDLGEDGDTGQASGVIVVSPDREIWTVGVRDYALEHAGEDTVVVGGPGWRESVHAERSGWDVAGNGSAYAVDLTVDGETTRSFESEPVRAGAVVDGHEIAVAPAAEAFELRVTANGSTVGTEPIPAVGEETAVGDLRFVTETVDGDERVVAESGDTRVGIAERETYD